MGIYYFKYPGIHDIGLPTDHVGWATWDQQMVAQAAVQEVTALPAPTPSIQYRVYHC